MLAFLQPLFLIAAVQAASPALGTAEPDGIEPDGTAPARVDPARVDPARVDPEAVADVLAEHDDVDVTLRGSPASMARQHAVAVASDLSFTGTLDEMKTLAEAGHLVAIDGGRHYEVMDWVFPFGLPEVRAFVERLAHDYRRACGEELVVTSLTRPQSEQLPNSHRLSVHPAGMAVDLRVPQNPDCREFLEADLLAKEEGGLVDITRERAPPHYHVAIFPAPYEAWADTQPELPDVTRPADAEAVRKDGSPNGVSAGGGWVLVLSLIGIVAALAAGWWWLRRRPDMGG